MTFWQADVSIGVDVQGLGRRGRLRWNTQRKRILVKRGSLRRTSRPISGLDISKGRSYFDTLRLKAFTVLRQTVVLDGLGLTTKRDEINHCNPPPMRSRSSHTKSILWQELSSNRTAMSTGGALSAQFLLGFLLGHRPSRSSIALGPVATTLLR